MELSHANILLRKPKMEDATDLAKLANNKKVFRNLRDGFPSPYRLKDAKEFIEKCQDEKDLTFSVLYDGAFCGMMGFTIKMDACIQNVELGYWLGEPFWNKGIATQAAKLLTAYGLNELGFSKIFAVVLEYNPSSMRVLEKAGYTYKGISLKTGNKNGIPYDEYLYEISQS